jgi:hypothetical protein
LLRPLVDVCARHPDVMARDRAGAVLGQAAWHCSADKGVPALVRAGALELLCQFIIARPFAPADADRTDVFSLLGVLSGLECILRAGGGGGVQSHSSLVQRLFSSTRDNAYASAARRVAGLEEALQRHRTQHALILVRRTSARVLKHYFGALVQDDEL